MFAGSRERLRSRAFRGALVVLAIIGLLWGWRKWSEPRYLGRGIRSWLEQLPYDSASNSEAREAMDSFGARAVPYLIEAAERPLKWEHGLLARIPRRYLESIVSLEQQSASAHAAVNRLDELTREEVDRAELQPEPRYPITEKAVRLWKDQMHASPQRFFRVPELPGPFARAIAPELRQAWTHLSPRTDEWQWGEVARGLAETHDPALVPEFLRYARPGNSDHVRGTAIAALGRNQYPDAEVENALRDALNSTNAFVVNAALTASARLGVCMREAISKIEEIRREPAAAIGRSYLHACDLSEPILRWRQNPEDPVAIGAVERNLGPQARADLRFHTPELLAAAGPDAKRFVPALSRMAQEPGLWMQSVAVRAIRAIDPSAVPELIKALPPPPPSVRARTSRAPG